MPVYVRLLDHENGVCNAKIKYTDHIVSKLYINQKNLVQRNFKIEACIEGGVEHKSAFSRVQGHPQGYCRCV